MTTTVATTDGADSRALTRLTLVWVLTALVLFPVLALLGAVLRVAQADLLPGLLPDLAPEGDTLPQILQDIGDCKRCRLHEGRSKIVFGVGDPQTKLVFVGEGPGADEDAQGIPFVGRAGQLLTHSIGPTRPSQVTVSRLGIV